MYSYVPLILSGMSERGTRVPTTPVLVAISAVRHPRSFAALRSADVALIADRLELAIERLVAQQLAVADRALRIAPAPTRRPWRPSDPARAPSAAPTPDQEHATRFGRRRTQLPRRQCPAVRLAAVKPLVDTNVSLRTSIT